MPRRPPSRIPRRLARKIDRLARAAHRFHRFAHHPLCDRYAGEVVRFGRRTRLCRGCVYAAIGGAIGLGAGASIGFAASATSALLAAGAATLAAAAILALTTLRSRVRYSKLATRLAPALLFACAFAAGAASRTALGIAAALAAAATVALLRTLYGKRGADRTPCAACPERALSPCSGFQRIVQRERAFQRVATRLMRSDAA